MAGSYRHCVYRNQKGEITPYSDHMALLDNMGDASEAIEEMLIMINFLSENNPQKIYEAHQHYLKNSGSNYQESFEKWFNGFQTEDIHS